MLQSTVKDITTAYSSLFISANENSFLNVSDCTFASVAFTNQIKRSTADFTYITASNFEGLFVDADQSTIAFSYGWFIGFENHGSFLLQSQDSPALSIEHSHFDAFLNSSVVSASAVESLIVQNTTFRSDASTSSTNQQTRRAIVTDSTTGTIRDCLLERMHAEENGGALILTNSKMTLQNNNL